MKKFYRLKNQWEDTYYDKNQWMFTKHGYFFSGIYQLQKSWDNRAKYKKMYAPVIEEYCLSNRPTDIVYISALTPLKMLMLLTMQDPTYLLIKPGPLTLSDTNMARMLTCSGSILKTPT